MTERFRYPWERFLFERGTPALLDDHGYLADPSESLWRTSQSKCYRVTELLQLNKSGIVILGESGIGKSAVMASVREAVAAQAPDAAVVPLDLGTLADAADLEKEIFGSQEMADWRAGSGLLYLLLDGLDEAWIGINNVVGFFQRRLSKLSHERLRLWISCRTTLWPKTLEDQLTADLAGGQPLGIYEIGPLRRADVVEAARSQGIEPEPFFDQVVLCGVQPLASHPLSLDFLLKVYKCSGGFPAGRTALYEKGLLLLCDEPLERRERGHVGKLSREQRFEVGTRIGALTLLSGQSAVCTGSDLHDAPPGVAVTDLVGGDEGANAGRVEVTEEAVRDVLQCGIFRDAGSRSVAFSHKSFAEFLAARYLQNARLSPTQRDSLLFVSGEGEPRLVPQLHETAAWLASRDRAFFDRVLAEEPEVLLYSDVATQDEDSRARVVAGLLARIEAREVSYEARRTLSASFRRLAHASIAQQLGAVIADRGKHTETRATAVALAEECKVSELASQLAQLALDPSEDLELRVKAGYAVCALGAAEACAMLKPLALSDVATDPDDQLRGVALQACWPERMTADELFQALHDPRRHHYLGAYQGFLITGRIVERLRSSELSRALDWAEAVAAKGPESSRIAELAGEIATRAWANLDQPGVLPRLARFVLKRYASHECAFYIPDKDPASLRGNDLNAVNAMIAGCQEQRRKLVEAIIEDPRADKDVIWIAFGKPPIGRSEDFEWYLERACQSCDGRAKRWADLARLVYNLANASDTEAWLAARERSPAVREVMNYPLLLEINSDEYRRQREEYLEWTVRPKRRAAVEAAKVPPQRERIERALSACLDQNPTAFWWLVEQLAVGDGVTHYTPPTDLRTTSGWMQADVLTRGRILQAASHFLHTRPEDPMECLTRSSGPFPRTEFVAPLSLSLLHAEDRAAFLALTRDDWRAWTPTFLVQFAGLFAGAQAEDKQTICSAIYNNAPDEARLAVIALIQQEAQSSSQPRIIELWEGFLDEELAARLMDLLGTKPFCDVSFAAILGWLVRHNVGAAWAIMKSIVQKPPSGVVGQGKSVAVASQALIDELDGAWSLVWERLSQDSNWGRQVIETICMRDGMGFVKSLSNAACGDLLVWLFEQYPPATDPDHQGAYSPGPVDQARDLRTLLLSHVSSRGTRGAWEAICRARDAFPECPWLADVALDSRRSWRQGAWSPPPPAAILELTRSRRSRYLRSGADLLEAIIESLKRYEQKLQGETPLVSNLWSLSNRGKKTVWRPRDEEHLSDNLAQHLRDDLERRGVIINREVKIRPRFCSERYGGEPGQRTDIRVDAVPANSNDGELETLTVIIEVKASWHAEVREAMRTQLVERYLRDNRIQYGLYVVGWFAAPNWDAKDGRRKRSPWSSPAEALTELEAQSKQPGGGQPPVNVFPCIIDCSLR